MENTLNKIQKLSNLARVLCKLLFVASIIGAVISTIAVALFASGIEDFLEFINKCIPIKAFSYLKDNLDAFLEESDINNIAANAVDLNKTQIIGIAAMGIVVLVTTVIIAKRAMKYFENELLTGTPFTLEGADDMRRLGLFMIITSCIASVVNGIIYFASGLPEEVSDSISSIDTGISMGILALVASLIFKYGAEISEKTGK